MSKSCLKLVVRRLMKSMLVLLVVPVVLPAVVGFLVVLPQVEHVLKSFVILA